ncbi:MAG TPA: antitermination protein NusB [Rhodanobacteraceae bacterium]|nr:antitermination protein NusB [Rhodanobacteraceae bacterium]
MQAQTPLIIQLLPIIIGWVTLALVNAGLAQGKNRRGLVWFVLSLVFGPLATLALVAMAKVPQRLF